MSSWLSTVLGGFLERPQSPPERAFECFPRLPAELRLKIWKYHFQYPPCLLVFHPTIHSAVEKEPIRVPQNSWLLPWVGPGATYIPPISCTALDPVTNLISPRTLLRTALVNHEAWVAAQECHRGYESVALAWDVMWAPEMDHLWHPTNGGYVLDRTGTLSDKENILEPLRRNWDPIAVNWEDDIICCFHQRSSPVWHSILKSAWVGKIERLAVSDSFDYYSGLLDQVQSFSSLREIVLVCHPYWEPEDMETFARRKALRSLPRDALGFVLLDDVMAIASYERELCKRLQPYVEQRGIARAIVELGRDIQVRKVVDIDGKKTDRGRGYWRRWDDPADDFKSYDSFVRVERYL